MNFILKEYIIGLYNLPDERAGVLLGNKFIYPLSATPLSPLEVSAILCLILISLLATCFFHVVGCGHKQSGMITSQASQPERKRKSDSSLHL